MTKKFSHQTQKAITVRFPIVDCIAIEEFAEKLGTTNADVVRKAWRAFMNEYELKNDLKEFEKNLAKIIFEICCSVSGLKTSEKQEALLELKEILQGNVDE